MNAVELFGFAPSTYVRTVRLVCLEKGIEYSLIPLEFGDESHRRIHPYLRMPALRCGSVQLFETLAIATYLNEEFPGPDLAAETGLGRARMYQWISASNDYFYKHFVASIAQSDASHVGLPDGTALLLRPLDQALAKHAFLAGDRLTLADLFLLPMLLYAQSEVADVDWLSPVPNLAVWVNTLKDRPSVLSTSS